MNPTLFDTLHPSDSRAVIARARRTDPATSHAAAESVTPGCKECIEQIRVAVTLWTRAFDRPIDAFAIARAVEHRNPDRWGEGTIRRRVKDAGLVEVDELGVSPRGRSCKRFTL